MAESWREVEVEPGVRLAVRSLPDPQTGAPPLLLHHGLASSQRIWDLALPHLVAHHRVVTFDARGHGRSSKPSTGYGFDRVSTDLRAVASALRLRRPVVIGHSWGGMVALDAGVRFPRAFGGLVLVDGGVTPMRRSFGSWAEAREALAPPRLSGMPVEEFRRMIRTFFADFVEVTPDVEEIVLSVMRVDRSGRIRPNLSRTNHFAILRAIWGQDPIGLHAELRIPTLAILAHGAGEPGWEEAKRRAAAELRSVGARTQVSWIEGIHDVPLQHPRKLAVRIRRSARSAVR
jgi:pimeloyl-ACP methyl ester carboxylesterase